MNGTSKCEVSTALPQEYSCTLFSVNDRSSVPPKSPTVGLNKIPAAPTQISRSEHKYRMGARRNFTFPHRSLDRRKGNWIFSRFELCLHNPRELVNPSSDQFRSAVRKIQPQRILAPNHMKIFPGHNENILRQRRAGDHSTVHSRRQRQQ